MTAAMYIEMLSESIEVFDAAQSEASPYENITKRLTSLQGTWWIYSILLLACYSRHGFTKILTMLIYHSILGGNWCESTGHQIFAATVGSLWRWPCVINNSAEIISMLLCEAAWLIRQMIAQAIENIAVLRQRSTWAGFSSGKYMIMALPPITHVFVTWICFHHRR